MDILKELKKDVSMLSNFSQEKRYELFDNKTELDLIERVVAHEPSG